MKQNISLMLLLIQINPLLNRHLGAQLPHQFIGDIGRVFESNATLTHVKFSLAVIRIFLREPF